MIYELRIYYTVPGKLPALNDRFANDDSLVKTRFEEVPAL